MENVKKLKKFSVESLDAYLEYDPEELAKEDNYLEGYDKDKENGREEGIEQGKIQLIKTMHFSGMTPQEIVSMCQLTQEEVSVILNEQSS